jgi:YkoP-like protein
MLNKERWKGSALMAGVRLKEGADVRGTARPASPIPRWERLLDRVVLGLGRSPWGKSGLGRPRGIMHIFRLVERILKWRRPLRPVRAGGILRFEIAPLPAREIVLRGDEVVRRGELSIILHFDNPTLAALSADEPSVRLLTWRLVRIAGQDFEALAQLVQQGDIPAGVRVIWAETVFYQVLRRFGFTLRPAEPSLRAPFARLFMLSLLAIYGRPRPLARGGRSLDHLRIGEAWLSIDDLLERFPSRPSNVRVTAIGRGG